MKKLKIFETDHIFCCSNFEYWYDEMIKYEIDYESNEMAFMCSIPDPDGAYYCFEIFYCPFCGKKLEEV